MLEGPEIEVMAGEALVLLEGVAKVEGGALEGEIGNEAKLVLMRGAAFEPAEVGVDGGKEVLKERELD